MGEQPFTVSVDDAAFRARSLLSPSSLGLLAANLLPLAGVLFWGWDAFVLLMLYWMETAVIGFWTIVRIATATRDSLGEFNINGHRRTILPLALKGFFVLHAGLFTLVHFVFLWDLFAGDWSRQIHGARDFVIKLVIDTGPDCCASSGRRLLAAAVLARAALRHVAPQ